MATFQVGQPIAIMIKRLYWFGLCKSYIRPWIL